MNTSNRQKKRQAKEGAEALRQKPGWDPKAYSPKNPEEALRQLGQESRNEAAYASAAVCTECARLRQELQDETALCETHLAAAMGL